MSKGLGVKTKSTLPRSVVGTLKVPSGENVSDPEGRGIGKSMQRR